MTKAIDVLCVGGPLNGRQYCVNRDTAVMVNSISDHNGEVEYPIQAFWHPTNQRWYWVALFSELTVGSSEVEYEIDAQNFQPAWDMRNDAAPFSQTETQS